MSKKQIKRIELAKQQPIREVVNTTTGKGCVQTFCQRCGGMESLKVDGHFVPPAEWVKRGFAVDIGCVCK